MNHIKQYKVFESDSNKLYHKLAEKYHENIKDYLYANIIDMKDENEKSILAYFDTKPNTNRYLDKIDGRTMVCFSFIDMDDCECAIYELEDDYFMLYIFEGLDTTSTLKPYICDTTQGVFQLVDDFISSYRLFNDWNYDKITDLYNAWMW